jgi:hypothetical protein
MKKGLFLATICISFFSLSSCGPSWTKKDVKTDTKNLTNFSAVDIDASVDAIITVQPGAAYSVIFKGDDEMLKDITAEVKDNTLYIEHEGGFSINFGDDKDLRVEITVPSLTGIDFSGAGTVKTVGNITGSTFDLDVSGAGKVEIAEINTDILKVGSSGVATLNINHGTARQASFDFSGAGSMNAYGLQCTDATAEISGVGSIDMSVSTTLNASLSGAGSINYKGNPTVNKSISGVGSIKDAN